MQGAKHHGRMDFDSLFYGVQGAKRLFGANPAALDAEVAELEATAGAEGGQGTPKKARASGGD
eukprot:5141086-Lingulodinium_polyedra.AAC.1